MQHWLRRFSTASKQLADFAMWPFRFNGLSKESLKLIGTVSHIPHGGPPWHLWLTNCGHFNENVHEMCCTFSTFMYMYLYNKHLLLMVKLTLLHFCSCTLLPLYICANSLRHIWMWFIQDYAKVNERNPIKSFFSPVKLEKWWLMTCNPTFN